MGIETAIMIAAIAGTVGTVVGGVSAAQSARKQEKVVGRQAVTAAKLRKKQIGELVSSQKTSILKSGVTFEGTPMDIFADTYKTGQDDINAILATAGSKQKALRAQGRNALIGSIAQAGMSFASAGMSGGVAPVQGTTATVTSAAPSFGSYVGTQAPVPSMKPF